MEYILAEHLKLDVKDVRRLVWKNFGTIVRETDIYGLLPGPVTAVLAEVSADG